MADNGSLRGTPVQNYGGFANAAGSFAIAPSVNIIERAKAIQGIFNAYNPLGANPSFRTAHSDLPVPRINPTTSNLDFAFSAPGGDPLQSPINFQYNAKGYPNSNFVQSGLGFNLALSVNKQVNVINGNTLITSTGYPLSYTGSPPSYTTPDGANGSLQKIGSNYLETRATGETYKYNPTFLSRIQSAAGSTWTISHDGSALLRRVIDSQARLTSFTWSPSSDVLRVLDPTNRATTLLFTTFGGGWKNPTGIRYPDGRRVSMTYRLNSAGNAWTINRLEYPSGGIFTNRYQFLGTSAYYDLITPLSQRLTYLWHFTLTGPTPFYLRVFDASLNKTTYTYTGAVGGPYNIRIVDPLLNTTTIMRDGRRPGVIVDPLGSRATISYKTMTNTLGDRRMSAVTLPMGGRFTFDYDSNDRVKQLFEENGNRATLVWDGNGNRKAIIDALGQRTSFTYNALNQVQSEINPLGERTTSVYNTLGQVVATINPLGFRTTNTYSAYGQLILQEDPLNRITSMQYDSMNRLTRMTDAAGGRTLYFYDANGTAIQSIINPANERRTYIYDLAGQLKATIDPLLGRTTNSYDIAGNLITTENEENETTNHRYDACNRRTSTLTPLDFRTSFNYNAASYLTSTAEPDGSTTQVRYTADGRVKATIDGDGNLTSYTYDIIGNRTSLIDPLLNRTTYFYDPLHRMIATLDAELQRTTYQYDAANRRIAVINAMRETMSYRYDKAGQLLAEILPNNGRTSYAYDSAGQNYRVIDPVGNIITTAYDLLGRPIYRIDPNTTNRLTTSYDAVGRVTQQIRPSGATTAYKYDKLGRRIRTVDPVGAIWTTVYDKVGRILQQIDPRRMTTTYRYDLDGRQVDTRTPLLFLTSSVYDSDSSLIATIDAESNRTSYSYDNDHRLLWAMDPHLFRTSYLYDANGRQTVLINAEQERVTSTYDKLGRVVRTLDPLAQRTTLFYDKVGRVTREILVNGGRNTYAYDINGNVRRRINPVGNITTSIYDIANRQIGMIDGEGKRWTTAYDAQNRILRTVDPLLNVATSLYDIDGRLSASIDPLLARTTHGYDAANRRIRSIDANTRIWTTVYDIAGRMTGSIPPSLYRTTYLYDDDNRTIAVMDPNTNRMSYVYDKRGLRTSMHFPTPQPPVTYTYDSAGWRTVRKDGRGNRTTYSFDKVGRETLWTYPTTPNVSFVYDKLGRVTDRTDRSGRYTMGYAPLGQLTDEFKVNNSQQNWTIDLAGRRSFYAASNPVVPLYISAYKYDRNDHTTAVGVIGDAGKTTYLYDDAGRRTAVLRPNKTRTSYAYDAVGRTAEIFHFSTSGTYTPLSSFTYTYDPVGNPTRLLDSGSSVVTWTYDADYQLVHERRTGTATYDVTHTYDPAGNRTILNDSGTRTTFTYDTAGQIRRSKVGATTTTFTYDGDGNLTVSSSGSSNRWDVENRMVRQVIAGLGTVSYTYDAMGRKQLFKLASIVTGRTTYLWDHWNVQQALGTPTVVYDLEPGTYGPFISQRGKAAPSYFHYDSLNSIIQRTDSSTQIAENARFTGYGVRKSISGTLGAYGWIGGIGYESVLGSVFVRQRWYLANIARWTGRDPEIVDAFRLQKSYESIFAGHLPEDVLFYLYVLNCPTFTSDPTGSVPAGTYPSSRQARAKCKASGWPNKTHSECGYGPNATFESDFTMYDSDARPNCQSCDPHSIAPFSMGGGQSDKCGARIKWPLDCVCSHMPDSAFAMCIRGCLQCIFAAKGRTPSQGDHEWCFDECANRILTIGTRYVSKQYMLAALSPVVHCCATKQGVVLGPAIGMPADATGVYPPANGAIDCDGCGPGPRRPINCSGY